MLVHQQRLLLTCSVDQTYLVFQGQSIGNLLGKEFCDLSKDIRGGWMDREDVKSGPGGYVESSRMRLPVYLHGVLEHYAG
jgi:hypothetical protein